MLYDVILVNGKWVVFPAHRRWVGDNFLAKDLSLEDARRLAGI